MKLVDLGTFLFIVFGALFLVYLVISLVKMVQNRFAQRDFWVAVVSFLIAFVGILILWMA
ncbi:hypothetical protein IV38_GL001154 [Lactobacillus selangorensis]|uniref:Uncharacterized protein n=1 Tax=Lactobacillus selangorensis TaxID=81857 RepID=A0A0R2FJY4_9LACO|nr:hypothetical protein [Lactobacillus selangorensis]KRN28943.1 hypothetical protein IV38_GL001154 [Lactobacillus selangorensis]KRN32647.1 hypothetical protein IV40_GL000699 [Lactobacillus selangorensis]